MKSTDPRIDSYIEKSADFAKPVLRHLRTRVHEACPDAEETLKWSHPSFVYRGKILCGFAAFREHCTFGFWHQGMEAVLEKAGDKGDQAWGSLGRLTRLADLPSDRALLRYIRTAARLNESETPGRPRPVRKPETGNTRTAEKGKEKKMNTRDYFTQCFKAEVPKFVRVLKAVPRDQGAYKPHPRSMSAGDLVWLLASELGDACEVVDKGQVAFVQKPAPAVAESLKAYEKNAAALKRRLAKIKDAGWKKKARFLVDGKVAWETTLGDMLWGFLFDGIHHRGQLSTYLRPMGAKVPSIYGPSADDPGM